MRNRLIRIATDSLRNFENSSLIKRLIFLFLLGIGSRMVAAGLFIALRGGIFMGGDAPDYIQFADYILEQGVWVLDIEGLKAHAGPGFPLLISIAMVIAGTNFYWLIIFINVILSSLIVPVGYLLAKRLLPSAWSFAASIWLAFYVPQIWSVQYVGKESIVFGLFSLLVITGGTFVLERKGNLITVILFLVSFFFLIHIDERYFFYLPFYLVLIFFHFRRSGVKEAGKKVLIILLPTLLLMMPWFIRNAIVYKRPVILTERTAKFTDPILGYNDPVNPYRGLENTYYQVGSPEGNLYYTAMIDSLDKGYSIQSSRADWKLVKYVKEGMKHNITPSVNGRFETYWNNFKHLWVPVAFNHRFSWHGLRFEHKWNLDRIIVYFVFYFTMIPFFFIGFVRGVLERNRWILFFGAIIIIHTIIHVFLAHAIERYRLPIDLLIVLIGFYGLFGISKGLFKSSARMVNE